MIAQSEEWFAQHIGKKYTFSFWIYAGQACQLSILQNDKAIGTVQIPIADTNIWSRKKVTFELQAPKQAERSIWFYPLSQLLIPLIMQENQYFYFFFTTIRGRRTSHTIPTY